MIDSIIDFINDEALPGLGNFAKEHAVNILVIVLITYVARKFMMVFISKLIRKTIQGDMYATERDERLREDTLVSTVNSILKVALWVIAIMLLLGELGIDIGPLVAGAGIAGVALGFGAQSLVKDFISGMFIIVENQYRVGDVIQVNQTVSGVVENFDLRQTVLRDLDGMVHHIPNGEITIATNMTMEYANVNLDIGVGYDTDIEKLEKVVNGVGSSMAQDATWNDDIIEAPKFLRLNNFGDSAIEIKIVGKTAPMKQWAVTGELRKRLKIAFDKNRIEIPFPQVVVNKPEIKTTKKN